MTAKKNRFDSIEGILGDSAERPPAKVTPISSTTPPETTEQPEQPARRRPQATPTSRNAGGTRRVVFRLDPELKTRLAAAAARDKCSQVDIVKTAIERADETGGFKDAFTEPPKAGLFSRTRRATATAAVPCELRVTTPERDLIDKLAKQHGAKDRTALIAKALELYL